MNILIVSENENFSKELASKLIFLRKDDKISISNHKDCVSDCTINDADVVLISGTTNETAETIQELKNNNEVQVILLVNSYDKDFILSCADSGMDDFVVASADDFELVIRVVNNIKRISEKMIANRNIELLKQAKIIDELTGFYSYDFSRIVIENTIELNLIENGIFMVLAPTQDSKDKYSIEEITKIIKNSIRALDVTTLGKGANIYILLPKTDLNGALTVFNKIKNSLSFEICAGMTEISNKYFGKFEKEALNALSEAILTNIDYVFAQSCSEQPNDWLDEEASSVKNFKLFRKMFNKKLENIIAPTLYLMQQTYEDKLVGTKIQQFSNINESVFKLIKREHESTLRIIYPGFAKLTICIEHEGLDSPENKEIKLQLSEVSQNKLIEIIESFIEEFKTRRD